MALPAFLAPLADAPRWQKIVLGIVPLALLGGAGYYFGIAPVEARVGALRAQRASQVDELTRTRAVLADLTRLRRQATEVERQIDVAKEKLPTEREIPTLYRTLSDAATQSGLTVTLFQPQGARVRDFYSEIPISLVAEGGYHDIGDFVARVAILTRATTIGELKLTGAAAEVSRPTPQPRPGAVPLPPEVTAPRPPASGAVKNPRHSLLAEITLFTYVYRPSGSPALPKPPAPAKPEPVKS